MEGRVEIRKEGEEKKVLGIVEKIKYVGDRKDIKMLGRVENGEEIVDKMVK